MTGTDASGEILDLVRRASAEQTALRVFGGNSKAALGCRFEGDPLDVSGHNGIVEYEPNELVITVRAGTRLRDIDAALAEHGQMTGFEPPRYTALATIGGTLACNLSGPARPWLGSVRDAVLGLRLINGRGEQLRFGGRVIKNVAGFDASRLQAGAYGALGVMTEVSIKVQPNPETSITLAHELDARTSVRRMNELSRAAVPLTGAAWTAGRQFIRLAGNAAAVESAARRIGGEQADDAIWSCLRDRDPIVFGIPDQGPLWRLSLRSTAPTLLNNDKVIIDWGGAQRFIRVDSTLENMSQAARDAGGYVMQLDCNSGEHEFMQQPAAAVRRIHENLKQAFDPKRIFNPGRLYGWL